MTEIGEVNKEITNYTLRVLARLVNSSAFALV